MPASNKAFGEGRGARRPVLNRMGQLTHPDTGVELPVDTRAEEWRGLEGFTGSDTVAKPKGKKGKATAEEQVIDATPKTAEEKIKEDIRKAAPSKRQAAKLAMERGVDVRETVAPSTVADKPAVTPKGKKVRAPRELDGVDKAQALIKSRIDAEKTRVFGSADEAYEPQITGKSTSVLDSLSKIHNALLEYHHNIGSLVNAEADFHEKEAQKHGYATLEGQVHLNHKLDLLRALQNNIRGIKELSKVRSTGTGTTEKRKLQRKDLSKNPLTETAALMAGAKKELAGSTPAIANVTIQRAQKSLGSALSQIRKSALGQLGILPQGITHQDVQDAFSSAKNLEVPKVDYSVLPGEYHERMGWSKPGHIWVGTMGGMNPTIRQMPVHPDSLAELMKTPINGKLPTRKHPDVVKMREAISEATKLSRPATIFRTDVGKEIVPGAQEEGQPAAPATRAKKETIKTEEGEIPEWERNPNVPKPEALVQKEKKDAADAQTIHENMLRQRITLGRIGLHPKTGDVVNLRVGDAGTDRILSSLGQDRAKEIYNEVKGE